MAIIFCCLVSLIASPRDCYRWFNNVPTIFLCWNTHTQTIRAITKSPQKNLHYLKVWKHYFCCVSGDFILFFQFNNGHSICSTRFTLGKPPNTACTTYNMYFEVLKTIFFAVFIPGFIIIVLPTDWNHGTLKLSRLNMLFVLAELSWAQN